MWKALLHIHKRIPWGNVTKHSLALCYLSLADAKSSQMAHTKPPMKNWFALSLQLCLLITTLQPWLPPPNMTLTWEWNFWLDLSSAPITLRFPDDLDSRLNLTTISGPVHPNWALYVWTQAERFPSASVPYRAAGPHFSFRPWTIHNCVQSMVTRFDVGKGTWIQIYDRLLGANNIVPLPNRPAFKDSQVKEHI